MIWARQFFLPALGTLRAGNGMTLVGLSGAGVFVAGEGDETSFLRMYDRDGNSLWTRNVPQHLQALSADATGAVVISATLAWNSPTIRAFDNAGALRFTQPAPGVFLHVAAPASGGGFYVGYKTFVSPGGPSRGFVTRYNSGGLSMWTHRYAGDRFADWGGLVQFGNRLYMTYAESHPTTAVALGRWAAASSATGDRIWGHDVAIEPGSEVMPLAIAVGPQGGYIAGWVDGALAGHTDLSGPVLRDSFLMKFTIDTSSPFVIFTDYRLPPEFPMPPDGFTGRASWTLSDDISGVSLVELQESSDETNWDDVLLPEPKSTSALIDVKANESHRFRVRATDKSGNKSPWKLSKLFETDLLQEDGDGTFYDVDWKPATLAGANGGSVMTTQTAGATAKLDFNGDAVGLVMNKGPHRGRVDVWLDGTKLTTLDLYAANPSTNLMVFSKNLPSVGAHLLTVVAQGTPGRPRVDIDAFEVRSTSP